MANSERWGGFLPVPYQNEPNMVVALEAAPGEGLVDQVDASPWRQPESRRPARLAELVFLPSFGATLVPSVVPPDLRLTRIHQRLDRDSSRSVEVALAYAPVGREVNDVDDADLHVVWNALVAQPLVRVTHDAPFPIYGTDGVTGWFHNPQKTLVRGHGGIFTRFEAKPPMTAERARIRNALQWFDGKVYRVVQGYGDLSELSEIAASLAN